MDYDPFGIALKLRSLGYSVIPSGAGDKHKAPAVNWTDFQKRLPTEKEIQDWQKTLDPPLWGIVTGTISGLVVVDADTSESRAALEGELGRPHIVTPRGGGHWYFKHPGTHIKTAVAVIPDVDIRGDGGFVNIIGSRPDGKYQLQILPDKKGLLPWDNLPERIRQGINGSKPATPVLADSGVILKEGLRNDGLTRLAGYMRHKGIGQGGIEAALLKENQGKCQPPLLESEVLEIAKSVSRYEPGPVSTNGHKNLTDLGNAERLVDLHGDKLRFNYERGLWLIFTGKRWEWDTGGKIVKLAKETARSIYHEAGDEPDKENRDALVKHAKATESNQRIKGMIELARSELAIKIEDLNRDQWLLNVNNGTIDLHTGELKPHDPADYQTYLIPIDYEPGVASKLWHDFLYRIFDDNEGLITYVKKSLGYCLTGSQEEQALWFLHGPGSNGKTTLTGIIIDILGDYAIEVDPLAFVADKNARTGPNEAIASLYNKRFSAATEVKTGMTLDVAILKRMTGGEQLRNERKFEHGFNFKPTHKLWLSGNHEPRITDTTNSIWNRLKYVPFRVTIDEKERIKGLREKIVRGNSPAILSWLVEGCLLWQSEGLGEPPEVREAIQAYRESQDILHDFLTECCLLKNSESIPVADLYREYKTWTEKNDVKPVGKTTFNSRLKEKGLNTDRGTGNQLYWWGIRLLTDEEKVTLVTLVTENSESSQEKSSRIKTFEKKGNKNNKNNSLGTETPEYPDGCCPECGMDAWGLNPEGTSFYCTNCQEKG
jgi:putative DNA primase/helicase